MNTNPPANCTLNRDGQKIGQINSMPRLAKGDKTRDDITLVGDKDGYQEATYIVRSSFEATTVGSVFIIGLIGVGIDAATDANNHYDNPANVTFVPALASVPAVASVAPVAHEASQPTPSVATAPGAAAKANAPAAVQTSLDVASLNVGSSEAPKTVSAQQSNAAASPPLTAAASPTPPAPGTWTAKIHWIPIPPSPRFMDTGESSLACDVAPTDVSIDAHTLKYCKREEQHHGHCNGEHDRACRLRDPWGYVNSVKGSLTANGGQFTGEGTCYNTQLSASAPTSQMNRHFCNVELSQVQ